MSRIEDVRQKYPELNISIIDLFSRLDSSGNNKYLGMICKIVSNGLNIEQHTLSQEIQSKLKELGINNSGLSIKETAVLSSMINVVGTDFLKDFKKFMDCNERNLITNKDLNSYTTMSQVEKSIEEADEKLLLKELEKTTHVVHNDENWLVIRPLSFASSAKYGASTKWCTTFNDRSYFLRHWRRGILVYFINKKTNTKWAVFKSLDPSNPELSWWNAADKKIEFFDIEFDDYMLPIIKQVLKSPQTNEGLCSYDMRVIVERECTKKENATDPFHILAADIYNTPGQIRGWQQTATTWPQNVIAVGMDTTNSAVVTSIPATNIPDYPELLNVEVQRIINGLAENNITPGDVEMVGNMLGQRVPTPPPAPPPTT
jgi:hypothetical protein